MEKLLSFVNQANYRLRDLNVHLVFKDVELWKDTAAPIATPGDDIEAYRKSVGEYVNQKHGNNFDATVLITAHPFSFKTMGTATLGGMCTSGSTAIVNYGVAPFVGVEKFIGWAMAHELGHLMGLRHDYVTYDHCSCGQSGNKTYDGEYCVMHLDEHDDLSPPSTM